MVYIFNIEKSIDYDLAQVKDICVTMQEHSYYTPVSAVQRTRLGTTNAGWNSVDGRKV